jgi:hypothetical protein
VAGNGGPQPRATPHGLDSALRRQLVGAFEPGVGFAIVHEGQLCYTAQGQAHIYVLPWQAKAVITAIGTPPGYDVVQVLTADRNRCTRTMI